ncbi:MAG: cytochrome c [Chloroflexi bacterium]|nr:cytochrome c [Chloroflexota bacterium]
MLKQDLVRLVGAMLLGGIAMLAVLPACGGVNAGETAPQTKTIAIATTTATTPATVVTAPPTTTATVAVAGPTATGAPAPTSSPTVQSGSALLAQGKLLYEKTAGGLGCAYCHGLDGRGKGPAAMTAADIRGKDEGYVRRAIQSGVPIMAFIKLSDDEITAVAAYLQYLVDQP